jgi:hypothetical protein
MTPLKVSTPGSSKKRPALSPRNPNMDNVLPLGADSTPHLAKLKISSPTPSAVMPKSTSELYAVRDGDGTHLFDGIVN